MHTGDGGMHSHMHRTTTSSSAEQTHLNTYENINHARREPRKRHPRGASVGASASSGVKASVEDTVEKLILCWEVQVRLAVSLVLLAGALVRAWAQRTRPRDRARAARGLSQTQQCPCVPFCSLLPSRVAPPSPCQATRRSITYLRPAFTAAAGARRHTTHCRPRREN